MQEEDCTVDGRTMAKLTMFHDGIRKEDRLMVKVIVVFDPCHSEVDALRHSMAVIHWNDRCWTRIALGCHRHEPHVPAWSCIVVES